jgi:organic radical activating enzyme
LASKENVDMTLDMFKTIVDKHIASGNKALKLLGGEPTQHPEFEGFLRYSYENKIELTIISNFLFSEETRNVILRYLEKAPINFLINSTELDKNGRMDIFKENYNSIYKFLYERNAETGMACGITIDQSVDVEYYIEYLQFLQKNLIAIEKMRLSLAFPGSDNQKGNFYFINNKKLGDYFIFMVKTLLSMNIPSNLDCILFPCMFEGKEEIKFITKFMEQGNRYRCGVTDGPTDYLPDGTAIYCYPTNRIKIDATKFKTSAAVSEALRMKYAITQSTIEVPEECKKCGYFGASCDGPCLGFYDLEVI